MSAGAPSWHLPIRVRLTAAFALASAVTLTVAGAYVFTQVKHGLDSSLDAQLRASARHYAALAARPDRRPLQRALAVEGEPAQLLDRQGHVLAASPRGAGAPLVQGPELQAALTHEVRRERLERFRILALPAGASQAVAIEISMRQRERALEELARVLFIGGPLILLLSCAAGWLVASGALRPVERMRRRAAEISHLTPDARLPVAETRDELHRLGTTLNAMLERIEAASRQERAFLANASHELRTPLAILKVEIDLALAGDSDVEDLRAALTSIGEEADRLARLSEDLLVIARGQDATLPLDLADLEIAEVVDAVVARFALVHPDGVSAEIDPALSVRADRLRLEQAITNLVDNALRHGSPPVAVSARRDGDSVEIHVTDHGRGFPEQHLDQVFERMGKGRAGGFGLGLALVASIVRAHQGDVGARNGPDGADVWITFPAERAVSPVA